ncbi:MAG: hypothetical protein LBT00_09975 [Spirochaetaceae bacterium]|jgi:hypothetical protein|nr:hypothetical protein [Spirochaetaceae bacterium]
MKQFLQKLIIFVSFPLIILLFIFLPPFFLICRSGELIPINAIIRIQQSSDNVLVGTAIQNIDAQLKFETTKIINPDILALGTSRVMQFRREYFNDDVVFYNAGGVVVNLMQYIDFITALEHNPEYVIIGLDQYFFNEAYTKGDQSHAVYAYTYDPIKIVVNGFKKMLQKELTYQPYIYNNNIGLTAKVHGDGFRKDGSYFYNRIINEPNSDYNSKFVFPFEDTIKRIDAGNARFEYGEDIYRESIKQVVLLLNECKRRNINVIAFIPPFAPYVNLKMEESGNYNYVKKIHTTLYPIFEQFDYEFYDFTDSSHLSDDSMYLDGFHGNDNVYHNILLDIKSNNSILGRYIK